MEFKGLDTPRIEFRAHDFRRIARDKLKGNWGIALGTSLIFLLCGWAIAALSSYFFSRLNVDLPPLFALPFLDGGPNYFFNNLNQYIYDFEHFFNNVINRDTLMQYILAASLQWGIRFWHSCLRLRRPLSTLC